jgi:hypothetical protein
MDNGIIRTAGAIHRREQERNAQAAVNLASEKLTEI